MLDSRENISGKFQAFIYSVARRDGICAPCEVPTFAPSKSNSRDFAFQLCYQNHLYAFSERRRISSISFSSMLVSSSLLEQILSLFCRMEMSSPPHPLMHFGMTGWMNIRDEETAYYKPSQSKKSDEWPPKFWKFALETAEEPKSEAAFVDKRRLARIRLIDYPAEDIRKVSPLVENGPDPIIDKDILTEEWLGKKLASKRVPIKALLLDQANISGIGNWVG